MQETDPVALAYVPAAQSVHAANPSVEIVPTAQSSQLAFPTTPAYFPDAQFRHVLAELSEIFPTGHAVQEEAPALLNVPATQLVH